MEDSAVREHAEAHGKAIVDGDLRLASQDLTRDAMAGAAPVMEALPRPTTGADVDSLRAEGDEYIVVIRYSGEDTEALIESLWGEVDGRPKILSLKLL